MGTHGDAATVLFGSTRRRILAWLLGHADREFYLREIIRHTGGGQGAVQRELEQLTTAGLVTRKARGHQVYFQANSDAPIFPELRSLFAKTAGVADVLREALSSLGGRAQAAFIFGSAARGELRPSSDIDLLIVGDVAFRDAVNALAAAQERLGREVNPTVYPPEEFRTKVAAKHHFLTSVLSEPRIFVIGDDDELVRLGAKWLAHKTQPDTKRAPRPAAGGRRRSRR